MNVLKTTPWKHQEEGLEFSLNNRATLLAMAVGTGKSLIVVGTILARPKVDRVLIICKKSMLDVWGEQFDLHAAVPVRIVRIPNSLPPKKKAEIATDALKESYGYAEQGIKTVIVCNFESVWREPLGKVFHKGNLDMVVVDESQHIKSAGATVSRYAHKIGKTVPYRMALTATPLHNSPLDAYGQFRFLDQEVFGTNFDNFRAEYTKLVPGPSQFVPLIKGYRNLGEMAEKMQPYVFSVTADVLDLPPEVYSNRYDYLPDSVQEKYDELKKDFITWIDEQTVVAPVNILTKLLRLQQLANGTVTDEEGDTITVDHTKHNMLREYLEELPDNEPVVVFTRFKSDVTTVHDVAWELGRDSCELTGNRNDLKDFQRPDGPPIIAVNTQAGGAGVDLTRAAYGVYYTNPWSLGDRIQTEGRLQRAGQNRTVTFTDLVVKDTVDEDVASALKSKTDVVQTVMSGLHQKEAA